MTHRIGLLSVTLRSDIVALLRKKIEFVKKSAPQRAERIVALARINNGGGRIEEQSLAKAMDSLESVLKKVADAQVQYEIWVNP